jgi:hypothetical protein
MASKTSKAEDWQGRRIDFDAFARALVQRRAEIEAETGEPLAVPRNDGARRTASKRALLAAVDAAAAKKGFRW